MKSRYPDRVPLRRPVTDARAVEAGAEENLRYIREVMARSGAFTAVPGKGSVGMGVTALLAALVAVGQPAPHAWLGVWIAAAVVAVALGVATLVWKARARGVPLRSGAGRKYVLGLLPPLAAAAVLTAACWQAGQVSLLPGLWLLLYGAGTVTGGAFSIRVVPLVGMAFMALGAVALFVPLAWSNALLALGFGGLHLLLGIIIIKHYGG